MEDGQGRTIDYLRISVTDRCNMRCRYCMPEDGIPIKPSGEILSYEEILFIVQAGLPLGINRIRITGGEPLVRKGILDFIKKLGSLEGVEDLSMTTNGLLLSDMAGDLFSSGLKRLNISLDTLRRDRFLELTRVDGFLQVWQGIEKALSLGFSPLKINVVVLKGFNEEEILSFVHLSKIYPVEVRFIEWMPLGGQEEDGDYYIPNSCIQARIEEETTLLPVKGRGSGPAQLFTLPKALGKLGFINPLSSCFCGSCNRLRLTAAGQIRPCLAMDLQYDLKTLLRRGGTLEQVQDGLIHIIKKKPPGHRFYCTRVQTSMYKIGG